MSRDDVTHSTAPLTADATDAAELHAAVDALADALHDYVDGAVGVRSEFGASDSDDDPRVLALENKVGRLNADLFDAIHAALGMHPDLTSSVWEPGAGGAEGEAGPVAGQRVTAELFFLGFMVATPPTSADMTLEGVIDVLDTAGEGVTEHMASAGYQVVEWAASRGLAPGFGPESDDED
jgi:hypothetical protein